MTTPDERRRNLLWGPETLAVVAGDTALPADMRAEAAELLNGYPPADRIQRCDGLTDFLQLQDDFGCLTAARLLFIRAQHHPSISEGLKHRLLVVLRHFD